MISSFDSDKNKKALMYTLLICGMLLLMFILISWKVYPPSENVVPDLIEVNLGNDEDGFGKEQPLIKGDRSPEKESAPQRQPVASKEIEEDERVTPDENAEADAAPVTKVEKKTPKVKAVVTPAPVITPAPKPRIPKIVYNGPGSGNGNNPSEDNGYRMQGNTPGGKGDNGSPAGNKDSYGNTPGGKIGRPRVITGNRKVVKYYSFTGDLSKATINAVIIVSPGGQGRFVKIGQGSTSFSKAYGDAIVSYLKNIQFDKAGDESTVTVQFNFNVN